MKLLKRTEKNREKAHQILMSGQPIDLMFWEAVLEERDMETSILILLVL